ncbi:MAG: AraC family transcriptional regulator [Pseudomonadota bacterium]
MHVTSDLQAMVYRANYPPQSAIVRKVPALFVSLVMTGGGRLRQKTSLQDLDMEVGPGDIGVAPPNASGTAHWPEMTVITVGIAVSSVSESFGQHWPEKLKKEVFTRLFRDPLVEATMMDVGYTRAGKIGDSTLLHAAHMIAHQLLDDPFECASEDAEDEVTPLSKDAVTRLHAHLDANLDRHVAVDEMAQLVGISRHHFSRRFKAATGISPHQFAIKGKLEHAANMLERDEGDSVISIAQKLGYANPAQFAKVFRRQFGLSPRKWRNRSSK